MMKEHEHAAKPHLDPHEQKKSHEEESLTADVTYTVICREGEKELERSSGALAWSALAGGLAMSATLLTEGLLRSHLPDTDWRPLVAKLGYPIGFLIVTLGSQQLYTENTVRAVVPALAEKSSERFASMFRIWGVVLLANLVGAAIMGLVMARTELLEHSSHEAIAAISREALAPGFWVIVLRGIFAGWLIALMVWMLPAAKAGQVLVIILLTYVVGIGKLSHVIAGGVSAFFLASTGEIGWGGALGSYVLPAFIGNTIGGIALVAGLNHAQVASDRKDGKKEEHRIEVVG